MHTSNGIDKKIKIFGSIMGISVLVLIGTALIRSNATPPGPGRYDTFAQCLQDKGAVFYGAFWCPHCNDQKKAFGSSQKLLPYVECSLANGQGQTQACLDKKIASYPTWEFADGTRENGKQTLEKLAEKTSCVLPE